MKLYDIVLTASSNLKRAKLRSFLTIIAIFIGSLTLTLTNGLGAGISSYIDRQVESLGAKDVIIIQPKTEDSDKKDDDMPTKYNPDRTVSNNAYGFAQPVLTPTDVDKIKTIDGLRQVEPAKSITATYIGGPNDERYQIRVSPYVDGTNIDMYAGSMVSNEDTEPEILVPLNYVGPLGLGSAEEAIGKTVSVGVTNAYGQVKEKPARVKGVLQPSLFTQNEATINKAYVSQLFDLQNEGLPTNRQDNYLIVSARFPGEYSQAQIDDLKKRINDTGYKALTIDDQIGIVKQVIAAIIGVLNFFAVIALVAASFGIINTLLMSVQERTKEIGLMKAMGMSRSRIFLLFSIEAAMLGLWGSLLGVGVAEILGRIANRIAENTFLKDLVGLKLLSFPWPVVVGIVLLIMFIAFLAGTLPARRAAKQNPIDALRYE